jgi:hypothetical protein
MAVCLGEAMPGPMPGFAPMPGFQAELSYEMGSTLDASDQPNPADRRHQSNFGHTIFAFA